MKILFLTNLPTPYRVDFYNELGKHVNLTVLVESKRSSSLCFNYNDDKDLAFELIYLNDQQLDEKRINWNVLKMLDGYDKVVISAYHTYTGLLALLYLKLKGLPYWFETDGGMISYNESFIARYVKRFFIGGAIGYFSPSTGSDEYLNYYGASDSIYRYPFSSLKDEDVIECVLMPSEKKTIRKKLGIKEEKMILAVGQFIHRKGFDVLLKTAEHMDENIGIYIVGGTPTDDYLDIQEKLRLTQVHFEGFKTKEELSDYFKAADLFVHPTREDIWGLVVNEAMAFGLPVITTNKCVAGVELVDKEWIVNTESPDQLKIKIEALMQDEMLSLNVSKRNLQKIREHTIEYMVKAHLVAWS
ncbi:MAG: glycosyltransferase family 4 protein [Bacteroidales bacterium]|nr:glycosyltransferase family 4 protein [Bacteroidales bacterium]